MKYDANFTTEITVSLVHTYIYICSYTDTCYILLHHIDMHVVYYMILYPIIFKIC